MTSTSTSLQPKERTLCSCLTYPSRLYTSLSLMWYMLLLGHNITFLMQRVGSIIDTFSLQSFPKWVHLCLYVVLE
jgi:hypothetical protein